MTTMQTRRESHHRIIPKKASRQARIMEILSKGSMTAGEITEELLSRGDIRFYDRNYVSPRLTELKERGLVRVAGERFCKRTGRNVAVWAKIETGNHP